jgi:glucose/arabinose dehydrogenase
LTRTQTLFALLSAVLIATAACAQRPAPRTSAPAPAPSASAPAAAPAPAAEPVQGSQQWTKPGTSNAEYRSDLESCYAYAQAQVDHDQRIEADTGAAFDSAPSGMGVSDLQGRMSAFEQKNRRVSLYHECMRSKGYTAQ